MALQIVNVRYDVDFEQLKLARQEILANAKAAGLSEKAAQEAADAYQSQVQAVKNVTSEVRKEQAAIKDAAREADKLEDALEQDGAVKGLRDAKKAADQLGTSVKRAGNEAKKTRSSLNFKDVLNIAGATALTGGLVGVLTSVTQGVVRLGREASVANQRVESQLVTFRTLLQGTGVAAEEVLQRLQDLSVATPFEPDQVIEAGKALLAFGEPVDALEDTLSRIGDIASGTGKDFNELSIIYGKARIAGTLYAEDINQLVEAGVPIIQEFADQLGISNDQVKKFASEGKISFDELETAFQNLTNEGGQFFNLTAAQSQTLAGRISTLQGQFTSLLTNAGGPLNRVLGFLVDTLSGLISRGSEITSVFDPLTDLFGRLRSEFNILLDSIGLANTQFSFLDALIGAIRGSLSVSIAIWQRLVNIIRAVVLSVDALVSAGRIVVGFFRNIGRAAEDLRNALFRLDFDEFKARLIGAFASSAAEESAARAGRNLASAFRRGIEEADTVQAVEGFRTAIASRLEAGVITQDQANRLQQQITDRLNEINQAAAAAAIVPPTTPTATSTGAGAGAASGSSANTAADEARANAAALREQERAAQAAARAAEELAKQQRELGQEQADLVETRFSQNVERIQNDLRRSIIEQDNSLNQVLANEASTAEERIAKEAEVNTRKIELNREAAEAIIAESRRVADANQAQINDLEFRQGVGGLSTAEDAELSARRALQLQLNQDLLAAEESLTAATLDETRNRVEGQIAIEEEKRERLNNIAGNIAQFGGQALSTIGAIFEAQAARQIAAAEGNEAKQKEIQLRQFRRQKALRIGEAIINGAAAAIRAFADLGPIGGAISAVLIAATTAAQIAKIASQQPPGFRKGVFDLQGPGSGTSDSIPARLSRGESVLTAKQTRENPHLIKGIHRGKRLYKITTGSGVPVWTFDRDVGRSFQGFNPNVRTSSEVQQLERIAAMSTIGSDTAGLAAQIASEISAGEYNRDGLRWRTFIAIEQGFKELLKRTPKD